MRWKERSSQACSEPSWRWGGGLAAASNPMRVSRTTEGVSSEGRVSFGRGPNESTGVDQRSGAGREAEVLIPTPGGGRDVGHLRAHGVGRWVKPLASDSVSKPLRRECVLGP
jgi:hypothetical protein